MKTLKAIESVRNAMRARGLPGIPSPCAADKTLVEHADKRQDVSGTANIGGTYGGADIPANVERYPTSDLRQDLESHCSV